MGLPGLPGGPAEPQKPPPIVDVHGFVVSDFNPPPNSGLKACKVLQVDMTVGIPLDAEEAKGLAEALTGEVSRVVQPPPGFRV